ncbi:hypothetical protein ACVPOQ_07450 [Staphylococcus aureus]
MEVYRILAFIVSGLKVFLRDRTNNPNIEDLIQAQQEHPLFDDLETASSAIITN